VLLEHFVRDPEAFSSQRHACINAHLLQDLANLGFGDAIGDRTAHVHLEFVQPPQRRQHREVEHAARFTLESRARPDARPRVFDGEFGEVALQPRLLAFVPVDVLRTEHLTADTRAFGQQFFVGTVLGCHGRIVNGPPTSVNGKNVRHESKWAKQMKPAPFDYHRPATLPEALALLERYEGDAKVLAGGQSLIPLMNMRLARPAALIDLERIEGLAGLRFSEETLHIGAMTRHMTAERSAEVRERCGVLSAAMPHVGHLAIRSRGTIGGSLAHADPAAELPAIATLFDAVFTIAGSAGTREVPWSDFFITFLTSCLEPAEILTGVTFTLPPPTAGWSFHEYARRHGDYALAGCTALVELDAGGTTIASARVALFGVDATPVRLLAAEPQFAGLRANDAALDEIAAAAADGLEPATDVHGTTEFRRDIARSLIARGVREAAANTLARRTPAAATA
jgi:carbon-monoxide dehydrogenase medium subunit